jgi:hypothetical protein
MSRVRKKRMEEEEDVAAKPSTKKKKEKKSPLSLGVSRRSYGVEKAKKKINKKDPNYTKERLPGGTIHPLERHTPRARGPHMGTGPRVSVILAGSLLTSLLPNLAVASIIIVLLLSQGSTMSRRHLF